MEQPQIELGLHKDFPEELYHKADGLSKSSLSVFLRSPFHYWSVFLSGQAPPRKETEAFRMGSIIHCAVLEPERFKNDYVLGDFDDKRSKAWKEFVKSVKEDGKEPLTKKDTELVDALKKSVQAHPFAKAILEEGDAEISAIAKDEKTGQLLRSRFDFLPSKGGAIVDLKTCQSASPRAFGYSCKDYSYDLQAVFYLEIARLCGLDVSQFVFIAVEKTFPFACGVYVLDEASMDRGRKKFREGVDAFVRIKEEYGNDPWPSYNSSPEELTLYYNK